MITLTADSYCYGNNKQYIARITGRDSKFTFCREFTGRKEGRRGDRTLANVDTPGLYELCDIDKRGNKEPHFRIVVDHPAKPDELINFAAAAANADDQDGTDVALKIAKRLDAGESLSDMIEYVEQPEDPTKPGVRLWKYRLRSKSDAAKASAAATIESAVESCWQVLQSFPEREAKKVLAALKARVSPPKTANATPDAESTADQPIAD